MTDLTGTPLKKEDVERALQAIKKQMLSPLKIPPALVVELLTIKLALEELLRFK